MTQERWQRLTEWPLTMAALIFLIAYAWQVIANLTGPAGVAAETVIWVTWALFACRLPRKRDPCPAPLALVLQAPVSTWRSLFSRCCDR